MKARASTSLAILLFAITRSIVGETSDIGKGEHPPELTRTFGGIVQRVDATTLSVSRPDEKHTFLLANCSEWPRVRVAASTLHRPVLVTYVGGREPYCAVKVQVLASLPKPTPKQEDTPDRYMTGTVRGLDAEHLIVWFDRTNYQFIIDALTMYYDREGYVILDPHPAVDLPKGTRVKLDYTGKREPFRVRSIELLK